MERSIYKDENIEVTPSFVHVSGVSYPLANITSIRVVEDNQRRILGVIIASVGLLIPLAARTGGSVILGVLGIASGVALAVYGMVWHLIITTGASERQAMSSRNKDQATRAGAAINVAIAQRDTRR